MQLFDITAGIAAFTAVFAAAWKLEDITSPAAKREIANWLKRVNVADAASAWPRHFALLFDAVFGTKHLSWRCFWRSCVASIVAVAIMLVIWARIYPGEAWLLFGFAPWFEGSQFYIAIALAFILPAIILNFVPDYLSLLESRLVIRKAQTCNRWWCLAALLILDTILTFLIFGLFINFLNVSFRLALGLPIEIDGGDWFRITEEDRQLLELQPVYISGLPFPIGVFFYSTFFTSLWVWLYAISVGIVRLTATSDPALRFLRWFLDIEGHPVRSAGLVAGVIVGITWWGIGSYVGPKLG